MGELSVLLEENGHTVRLLTTDPVYGENKRGLRRWLHELKSHVLILLRGLFQFNTDLVISLTSPVCLVVTAAFLAFIHRAKSLHWAMDLYPDLAVALNEIKPGLLVHCLRRCVQTGYASMDKVVALDEDMRLYLERQYGVQAAVVPPWPGSGTEEQLRNASSLQPDSRWEWMYSGNLGRAHEWEILAAAQAELERRGLPVWLIIQGGGASVPLLKTKATELGLRQCEFREYVPKEQLAASLLAARVQVATQKIETTGLLWPSKLALLVKLPRALVWIGDTRSRTAALLNTRPRTFVFDPGQAYQLAECLGQLYRGFTKMPLEWDGFAAETHHPSVLWLELIRSVTNPPVANTCIQ